MTTALDIVLPAPLWQRLARRLLRQEPVGASVDEQLAFVFAAPNVSPTRRRLLAHELLFAEAIDLERQGPMGIAPTGEFVAKALSRCRQEGWSLIEVHSHPFDHSHHTTFSGIDWANDKRKMPALVSIMPSTFFHATMVLGQCSSDAHYYDQVSSEITPVGQVTVVGGDIDGSSSINQITPSKSGRDSSVGQEPNPRYDRQAAFFSSQGQGALTDANVAVVGLGGLGSFAALELAHLGIGQLTLIDPDTIELSNLNRLLGAREADIGRPKVEVFEALVRGISSDIEVTSVQAEVLDDVAIEQAKATDLLLGCVDNHGARLTLNHLAIRYLIPLLDAGTGVRLPTEDYPLRAGGQIQLVAPGTGCLECRGFIDARRAAFDLASPQMKDYERAHGYGTEEAAPSVAFLNGVVASLQVGEAARLLSGTSSIQGSPKLISYNALEQKTFVVSSSYSPECATCGEEGVVGVGDLAPFHHAGTGNDVRPTVSRYPSRA